MFRAIMRKRYSSNSQKGDGVLGGHGRKQSILQTEKGVPDKGRWEHAYRFKVTANTQRGTEEESEEVKVQTEVTVEIICTPMR